MTFEILNSVLNVKLNPIAVLALASLLMLFGIWLKARITFLSLYCIPTPVASGLIFAVLVFALKQNGIAQISLDTAYQSPFMLVFFATVGLEASLGIFSKGGKDLVKYLLLGVIVATWQNFMAISMAFVTGISPMHGVMLGAATQVGGHGGAAMFGAQLESMGYPASTAVGMAAATFGVVAGSLTGGPLGRRLIKKYNLSSSEVIVETRQESLSKSVEQEKFSLLKTFQLLFMVFASVTLGSIVCNWITEQGITFPSTVGAMIFGVLFRNLNDRYHFFDLDLGFVSKFSDTTLNIFLTISIMSMALDQLVSLAIPIILILLLQMVSLGLFAYFVVFRVMGKNYDAAVMCSGLMGHGLGATPNAVANISGITEKYGPSTRALLICSITGAFALDLYQLPLDSLCIAWLHKFL